MGEWLAGNRIRGTTAERPSGSLQSPNVGGWVELARNTLSSAGDLLDTGTFTAKKYLCVQVYTKNSGTINHAIKFNGDGNANYSFRRNLDGGTDGTDTNTSNDPTISMSSLGGFPLFATIFITNNTSKEKLTIAHTCMQNTAGAGNAPRRREGVAKWANTSDQITQITVTNSDGGSYDSGSEIVVLGWEPTDTHTDNFWGELYSNQLSSNNQEFSTGTISAKKYLWLQFYQQGHTGNSYLRFNADSGSNYSRKHEINGAADANVTSQSQLTNVLTGATGDSQSFTNMFIVNDSSKEKLCIFSTVFNAGGTTGAGNAPQKINGVCKWSNTSDSITSVQVTDNSGAGFDTGSFLKIWGSD